MPLQNSQVPQKSAQPNPIQQPVQAQMQTPVAQQQPQQAMPQLQQPAPQLKVPQQPLPQPPAGQSPEQPTEQPAEEPEKKKGWKKWVIIAAISLIVLGLGFYFFLV